MLLFRLNSRGTAVLHKDVMRLVPFFKNLSDEELLFLILYCDIYSPFHQFPEQDRLLKAKRQAFKTSDYKFDKKMKSAMGEYMDLQYDPRREMMKANSQKIEHMRKDFIAEKSAKRIKDLQQLMKLLQEENEEIEDKIYQDELREAMIMGDKKMSLIEQLQKNKKLSELKDHEYPEIKIIYDPVETGAEESHDYSD